MKPVAGKGRRNFVLICALLVLGTLAAYWRVGENQFLNYDDPLYVTENTHVRDGLTWPGVVWAFRAVVSSNWHPVTLLSHMMDVEFFGLNPAAHHLMNLFFHIVNSLLLFLLLKRMTRALWRSAFVAALFAMHPLRVESVAWIAERKDVLSTFFFLLTIWGYVRFTECKIKNEKLKNYLLAMSFFALGLMSKPMLVTLPFVLLLLDHWPLGRVGLKTENLRLKTLFQLVIEKIPFLALSLLSCGTTLWAQRESMTAVHELDVGSRVANAALSYWRYIGKTLWPSNLSVLYPYEAPPVWLALVAGVALVIFSVTVIRLRRQPFIFVGWFWFLGTLVPVIGLVQVGYQAMADRYTYIPSIGFFIVVGFGLREVAARLRLEKFFVAMGAIAALAGCLMTTRLQVKHWRDSEMLFRHAAQVTKGNYLAHNNLGSALAAQGRDEEALASYIESVRLKSDFVEGLNNAGQALMNRGQIDEAENYYHRALESNPKFAEAHYNLGYLRAQQGGFDEAILHFRRTIALKEEYPEAHTSLGNLLAMQQKFDEAILHFRRALQYHPENLYALNNLGSALMDAGRASEAAASLRKAVELVPASPELHFALGNACAAEKKSREALAEFQAALRLAIAANNKPLAEKIQVQLRETQQILE